MQWIQVLFPAAIHWSTVVYSPNSRGSDPTLAFLGSYIHVMGKHTLKHTLIHKIKKNSCGKRTTKIFLISFYKQMSDSRILIIKQSLADYIHLKSICFFCKLICLILISIFRNLVTYVLSIWLLFLGSSVFFHGYSFYLGRLASLHFWFRSVWERQK